MPIQPVPALTPAPPVPSLDEGPTVFPGKAFNFTTWQADVHQPQLASALANVYNNAQWAEAMATAANDSQEVASTAAERAESSANNVSEQWSPTKNYALGERVFVATPVEYAKYTYRRLSAGISATPPYDDPATWVRINGLYAELTIDLAAASSLNAVITSGFYKLGAGHTNAPVGVDGGQLMVSRGGDSAMQIASSVAGDMHFRTGSALSGAAVWTAWQRMMGDATLLEKTVGGAITEGNYWLDPKFGTVHHKGLQANAMVSLPPPRTAGDQVTLCLYQQGSFYFTLSANVTMQIGQALPTVAPGEALVLTFMPKYEGSGIWWCSVVGKYTG